MRGSVLKEAMDVINGDRQDSYGNPEDCFKLIADYWNVYLGAKLNPADVGRMMALLKIARMAGQGYKRDNYVDAAGYLGLVDDMEARADKVGTVAAQAKEAMANIAQDRQETSATSGVERDTKAGIAQRFYARGVVLSDTFLLHNTVEELEKLYDQKFGDGHTHAAFEAKYGREMVTSSMGEE